MVDEIGSLFLSGAGWVRPGRPLNEISCDLY